MKQLTRRECSVLQLVAHGATTKEIAARLDVSASTVKFHVENAMRKLGASSRSEAVALAIAGGCISP